MTTVVGLGATRLARGLNEGALDGIGTYTQALLSHLPLVSDLKYWPVVWKERSLPSELMSGMYLPKMRMEYDLLASAFTGRRSFNDNEIAEQFSLFHATDHFIPKLCKTPVIATLMDPVALMYPEWVRQRGRKFKNWLFRKEVTWAEHYITISHFVVDDLVKYFSINREDITVIPLGVDDIYFQKPAAGVEAITLEKYGLNPGFFLFIGTIQPRKNLKILLDAFSLLPVDIQKKHSLVVAGRLGWGCEEEVRILQELTKKGVAKWLDYVSTEEKRVLLSTALGLVFPSLYEGFGLPVLEAFASGLPVIGSNTTALAEVIGDAGIQVNPLNVNELCSAMCLLANEPALALDLSEKGLVKAYSHTWRLTSTKTAEVYKKFM